MSVICDFTKFMGEKLDTTVCGQLETLIQILLEPYKTYLDLPLLQLGPTEMVNKESNQCHVHKN